MFSTFGNAKRRWLWTLASLLIVGLVATVGGGFNAATAQAPAVKQTKAPAEGKAAENVAVHTVGNGDIVRTLLITGELKAIQSTDIMVPATRSSGSVTITYMALEGASVRKGEKLLEFDSSSLTNQVTELQRQVDEAALSIQSTKQDLESQRCSKQSSVSNAEGNFKIAKLNADIPEDLLPHNTYLNYQNTYEKSVLTLSKSKQDLANFEASYEATIQLQEINKAQREIQLKRTQNDINLLSIDAPQDGVVIYGNNRSQNRKYQVGDTVFGGGMSEAIITLPDLSAMQVVGFVYDTELQYLSPGMPCSIFLDAIPTRTWRGKIGTLTNIATQKGFYSQRQKVFRAVIPLETVDPKEMKPGMSARTEVILGMASNVVVVPRELLGVDDQGHYYVLKDTGPKTPPVSQAVQVGAFGDSLIQIISGLNVGDRLVPIKKTLGD
jgi:HlyD family secretion protein